MDAANQEALASPSHVFVQATRVQSIRAAVEASEQLHQRLWSYRKFPAASSLQCQWRGRSSPPSAARSLRFHLCFSTLLSIHYAYEYVRVANSLSVEILNEYEYEHEYAVLSSTQAERVRRWRCVMFAFLFARAFSRVCSGRSCSSALTTLSLIERRAVAVSRLSSPLALRAAQLSSRLAAFFAHCTCTCTSTSVIIASLYAHYP